MDGLYYDVGLLINYYFYQIQQSHAHLELNSGYFHLKIENPKIELHHNQNTI